MNWNILLFLLVPVAFMVMFLADKEAIQWAWISDTILFNLSIGYVVGVFIYFLTGYLPERKRAKIQNKIVIKLVNQVIGRINGMMHTILKCANGSQIDLGRLNKEEFTDICRQCKFDNPSGSKKIISDSPLILGDLTVKESLLNDWAFVKSYLDEIDMAAVYIEPEVYHQCINIKKSSLSFTLKELNRNIRNTDLGAWGSQFYELYQEKILLEKAIDKLEKDQ